MISQNRRLEFWNFLTAEKNQPRPKGITTQRLAVIRPSILELDEVWIKIIDPDTTGERSAVDFYGSNESAAVNSRTVFWTAVRNIILQDENNKSNQKSELTLRSQNHRKTKVTNKQKKF